MGNFKIKVCGLTQLQQIQELISLKVDFLGFIFYEKSPRYVLNHLNLKEIAEIPHFGKVGVFVNVTVENIIEIVEKAKLNFVQLHGDENEDFIERLRKRLKDDVKIIKVIRIGNEIKKVFDSAQTDKYMLSTIDYFLFDTDSKAFGGTGKTFDWNILNEFEIPKSYFLSGGISSENIHKRLTIKQQPMALDINSKFEIEPGVKDIEKIKELLNIIKMHEG